MKNHWIYRVTGQPVTEAVRRSALRRVMGEAEEQEEKAEPAEAQPQKKAEAAPEPEPETPPVPALGDGEPEATVDAGLGADEEAALDQDLQNQAVEHLVSSWQSGSKMDVAAELMYTPVTYSDFVRMLFRIGPEDGIELGGMLDELSEVRPSIDQPGGEEPPPEGTAGFEGGPEAPGETSADRVLAHIAHHRRPSPPMGEPESTHAMP